jgi:diguanylate cyclase
MAGSVGGVWTRRVAHVSTWAAPRRTWLLFAGLSGASVAVVASAVSVVTNGVGVNPIWFGVAVLAIIGSQLARIRIRVGGDFVFVGWSEVGAIALLCLLPPIWAPLATVAAMLLAIAPRWSTASARGRRRVAFGAAVLVFANSVAAAVAGIVVDPRKPVVVSVDRPLSIVPLVLACAALFLVGTFLMSAWLACTAPEPTMTLWSQVVLAKRTMMAGTAAVGSATAVVIGINVAWLALLAPVLWVMHRVYEHQRNTSYERVSWASLAEATRHLNQLDERGVALAVLRGAATLFQPESVEVTLVRPQGSRRTYRATSPDHFGGFAEPTIVDEHAAGRSTVDLTPVDSVVSRRLTIGGDELGEVKMRLGRARLTESDGHAFSAFCEAAASAFHDAATHRTLRAMTARSTYDAMHDPLTGLPNRSMLLARGNAELNSARDRPVALLLMDIDGLQRVNDALGYAAGDELLTVVARRLRERQHKHELLGRPGGDEFAVLLHGTDEGASLARCREHALERAHGLIEDLAEPALVGGVTIAAAVAVGIVVDGTRSCDMAELLRRADVARHQAEQAASRIAEYDEATDPSNLDRLMLLADLRDALAEPDAFVLQLQPAVDLRSGLPVSAEVVVGWQHPRRGLLQPADFIRTVEHSDLADEFTLHVIDLVLGLASGWATQGVHVPVSVNLCGRCTVNADLPRQLAARLAAHGVPARQLKLGITESVAIAEPGLAEQVVAGLRELGVQVSVNDFGTGSASLSFLTRFPVDEVKIDRSFVATVVDSPEAAAIVKATVDLAHHLGLRVIAEGVDRPEQRTALLGLGVIVGRGLLFHPPLSVEDVALVLQGRTQLATERRIPIVRAPAS